MKSTRIIIAAMSLITTLILLAFVAGSSYPVKAANGISMPIKVGVIVDESYPQSSTSSPVFQSVRRVLNANRIPWEALDISGGQHYSFLDGSGNPLYSTILINVRGAGIDAQNTSAIINVVKIGVGAVGLLPDCVNAQLAAVFGISTLGSQWVASGGISIERDEFTFAYAGEKIVQSGMLLMNHSVASGAVVVARDTVGGIPAIWVYPYGSGKTVFFNNSLPGDLYYQGILMQGILYSMPVGLSSPASAGAIEVDDCTRTYYFPDRIQELHYDFISNFIRFLRAYNLKTSVFVAFSYSGNVNDFWTRPESVDGVNWFLRNGHEIGLHCGGKHIPLDPAYWGGESGVDGEVDTMMQATQELRTRLQSTYGVQLPEVVSYVAPMECMSTYGYQSLDARTGIKYVGTAYAQQLSTSISDSASTESKHARSEAGLLAQVQQVTYPVTFKDFGVEPGTNLYNLPRCQNTPFFFAQPQANEYYYGWSTLRSMIESGQPYLIFTHPDEMDMLDSAGYPDATMAQVFQGYTAWADYVATHYPFYRWLTAGALGQVLQSRSGYLNARWIPGQKTLEIMNAQQDEALQVKTPLYLSGSSKTDSTLRLTFSETPTGFVPGDYDIVKTGANYFIYPPGSAGSLAVVPSTPFQFIPYSQNQPPVLNAIGNKTVVAGQVLSFTVSATDPNGDKLTYSASNLPAGASFDAATRTFSWKPATAGAYPNVRFQVSDGSLTDYEDITITVTSGENQPPVLSAIGNKTVVAGQVLSFTVSATDPNGDALTYSASNLPAGASFDPATRTFSWKPTTAGMYPNVRFQVSDGSLTDYEDITITVQEPSPGGEVLVSVASGGDDGFSGAWGYYNNLAWTEAGQPYNAWLRFTGITIPAGAVIQEAHLEMVNARWDAGTSLMIRAEKSASPAAPATTADHNARTRTAAGASWTSGYSDWAYHNSPDFAPVIQELVNSYSYSNGTILILVDDSGSSAGKEFVSQSFESGSKPRLYIKYGSGTPVNQPPVLNAIGNKTVVAGQVLSFTVSATDPNGDALTYSASNLPAGASFDPATRTFSWKPSAAGVYPNVRFQVSDSSLTDYEDITITVTSGENQPPVLNAIGNKTVVAGQVLSFTVSATDPNGDKLTYSASNLPAGASFDPATRTFSWKPSAVGVYPNVRFQVSDGSLTDYEDITITVQEPSPGGEILVSVASGGDDGFSGGWGYYNNLAWTEAGQPYNAWLRFTGITIPAGAVIQEAHLEMVNARWDAGTSLMIRAEKSANPAAPATTADHNARTRTVAGTSWTSGYSDWAYHNSPDFAPVIQELVNSYSYSNGTILILVDNSGSSADKEFVSQSFESGSKPRLYIKYGSGTPVNQPPVLNAIGNKTVVAGQVLSFTISATDPNGDALTYSASNLPAGASFDPATRTFSWKPSAAGVYPNVRFQVSDGSLTDYEDITITVTSPVNQPPVLNAIGNKTVVAGQVLSFTVSATDPNGDALTYSASNLPAGASFDPATRTFSWKPTTAGMYPNVRFQVSDGSLTDYEDITIMVQEPSPGGEVLVSVASGGDDGFSGAWGYYNNLAWTEAGQPYNAWLRFTGITIPAGAVIQEAHLEMVNARWDAGTSLMIRAEKSASPAAPATTADHNARTRTAAGASWTSGYSDWAYHNSPDFAPVIQELVNSYSYSNGTILILVDNSGSSAGKEFVSQSFESGSKPRLYIKYG